MTEDLSLNLVLDLPEDSDLELGVAVLERLARAALGGEGYAGVVEVELLFVDAEEIRQMNAEYRGRDEVTDVLSFPLHDEGDGQDGFVGPPDGVDRLGDVVICLARAREQADEYGHSVEREIGFLFVHGLLHLLGYDHEEEGERAQMRQKEEAILATAGLER